MKKEFSDLIIVIIIIIILLSFIILLKNKDASNNQLEDYVTFTQTANKMAVFYLSTLEPTTYPVVQQSCKE